MKMVVDFPVLVLKLPDDIIMKIISVLLLILVSGVFATP